MYRHGRQREGEWEGRRASERARGWWAGVARRRAGGTRRARGSSGKREHGDTKKKKKTAAEQADTQEGHEEEAGRGRWGGTGGLHRRKGPQSLAQRNTKPKTRIEPYRPPRPTIRELMEGRPAGADEGGVPPKGGLGRPPRTANRSEDRAEALGRGKAREKQPRRGDDRRRAHGTGEQHKEGGQETEGRGG